MTSLFWLSFFVLAYIYAGYPLLVCALAQTFGRLPKHKPITPKLSLYIPAYNEQEHIEAKIKNSLTLDYPKDKLEIVVASDGSTDKTNEIVKRYQAQGVKLIAMRDNIGKSAMLDRTVPLLTGEITVFSDTSSELEPDALRVLVRNFADAKVGCASGLYRIKGARDLRAQGEGLYWKYETFIKRQESRLHSILGAHGAFYAIRTALFEKLEHSTINDDYLIPMRIVAQGYRAIYEPGAVAWEREQASVEGEFARRRRIAAGNCQQMVELRRMLSPLYGWVALCFFSHKVLRTLSPVFLLTMLLGTWWLPLPVLAAALAGQVALYTAAYAGYVFQRRGKTAKWLSPPLYFCLGNLAMLAGLFRYLFRRHTVSWERSR